MDQLLALGLVSTGTKILELAAYQISGRPICIGGACARSARGPFRETGDAEARAMRSFQCASATGLATLSRRPVASRALGMVRESRPNRCWRASLVTQRSSPLVSCPDCLASGRFAINAARRYRRRGYNRIPTSPITATAGCAVGWRTLLIVVQAGFATRITHRYGDARRSRERCQMPDRRNDGAGRRMRQQHHPSTHKRCLS